MLKVTTLQKKKNCLISWWGGGGGGGGIVLLLFCFVLKCVCLFPRSSRARWTPSAATTPGAPGPLCVFPPKMPWPCCPPPTPPPLLPPPLPLHPPPPSHRQHHPEGPGAAPGEGVGGMLGGCWVRSSRRGCWWWGWWPRACSASHGGLCSRSNRWEGFFHHSENGSLLSDHHRGCHSVTVTVYVRLYSAVKNAKNMLKNREIVVLYF